MSQSLVSLFLSQSYKDAWEDYIRSLTRSGFPCWDYVILTASNDGQAAGFTAQIEKRQSEGTLPSRTHFAVLPDPQGKRVGSGGATLGVIRYIAEREGTSDFTGLRILVIHSGGDSKRVPQYSALGKLFSPVPHELPDGRSSTLFDEFIISMSGVAGRIREGMLLLSGDVLLLFNPLQIDHSGDGAAAISFKEHVETGKNHGVFLMGENGCVARFLHKQSVDTLRAQGAVNENDCVDIDTGSVIFSPAMLASLFSLISCDGRTDEVLYKKYVNETVRLSLYGDFLYPLASDSTLEDFQLEKPEGSFCDELAEARAAVWKVLRPYRMKLLRLSPSRFIHFGTTIEIMHLMSDGISEYDSLGWSRCVNSSINVDRVAGYNSALSAGAVCAAGCYLEVSYVGSGAVIGENTLLSYIDVENEVIPPNIVLHGLKQFDGKFVARIYGIEDNPKEQLEYGGTLFGKPLDTILKNNGIAISELWSGNEHSLWSAALYPACDTVREAVSQALNLYAMAAGNGDVNMWRSLPRKSLCEGFNAADPHAIIAWDQRMSELVRMDGIEKLIRAKRPAVLASSILKSDRLTKIQREWLDSRLAASTACEAMRLHYYIGKALGNTDGENHISKCFSTISGAILQSALDGLTQNTECRIATDKYTVHLPLRVNWGGGWSDTPPYCTEMGGTVLNASIKLDGRLPVEVTFTKIAEHKVIFDSRDMDKHGEFTDIASLQSVGDPYDPFVLQKAALLACGIIPTKGGNLDDILSRMGGGFIMQTEVTDVPKGSGLGTSSILAAACVKALFGFIGAQCENSHLYDVVLCMEQIMSTGGGWQDQVGGITNGIKYITSAAGMKQNINVVHLDIPADAMKELNDRFIIIYTGQRRLARNLLRDVVGRYIGSEPDALFALNEIQRTAALMRFELERGNIDAFAALLSEHWELSKKLDSGSSNTLIDQIFRSIDDLLDGKMICGAGGGGFLQAVMKKGVTKAQVQKRLKEVFQDGGVSVWNCELI